MRPLFNYMGQYICQRLLTMVLVLWVITTLTFLLMQIIPGGPFTTERVLPAAIQANIEAHYNLNQPLWTSYVQYLRKVVQFDLGPSFHYGGRSVSEIIKGGFPISATLGLYSLVVAIFCGIPLGIVAAWRHNTILDQVILAFTTIAISIPSFVTASVLIYLFAYHLRWLPPAMWGSPSQIILPVLALAILPAGYFVQIMRTSVLETLDEAYISTAFAKGLPLRLVLYRHALKISLLPLLSLLGPILAQILTGSFVIEHVFAIPGLGRHFVTSVYNRDYPVIMGMTIFYSFLLVSFNFLVDLSYRFLDPRIRLE